MINNPILPGFNPDPAICRVGKDYYIATSTFEWYPGVQIHHSTDMVNWSLVARPLNRADLLDMRGYPDSCGVWAPCLSHSDGNFWICYTDVKRFDGNFKDTHNNIITCETIDGDWSAPVYTNSSGFDPSLFHDEDGRKYFLNMVWDHRPDRSFFRGIVMQEYLDGKLIGPSKIIFDGTEADCTEGPHIYKHNGYYYLITTEGGTGYDHCVTIARSKDIWGPYEVDPKGMPLTSKNDPDLVLQRAGHGSLIETPDGEWYFAHLCSRPLPGTKRSPLGRETAIQKFTYTDDGWFRMENGSNKPEVTVEGPDVAADPKPDFFILDDFDDNKLNNVYQWLRTPYPEDFMSLDERPGFLRLKGGESLGSLFNQALVARRQVTFDYDAETVLEFEPDNFQQMAGLVCYYNGHKHHYLYISHDGDIGKHIGIMSSTGDLDLKSEFPDWNERTAIEKGKAIYMRASIRGAELNFYWSYDGSSWKQVGPTLDASLLCDEAGKGEGANFTGSFVGLCAQDLTGRGCIADFDSFSYQPL